VTKTIFQSLWWYWNQRTARTHEQQMKTQPFCRLWTLIINFLQL